MPVFTTAGSKVFIGGPKASGETDLTTADFTSEVWTEIGWVENIGTFGDVSASVDGTYIGRNRVLKLKGSRDAGNLELVMGIDYADPGQLALLAAEKTNAEYSIKIEFNDAPVVGASPKNSTRMFVGMVMTASEQLDGANNIMKLNSSVAINSNIVRTNASAT